jgi:hypothetical protein
MQARNNMHILTGINELAEEWLRGRSPKERFPIEAMFNSIENNFLPSKPENLSQQNWRLTKETAVADDNPSLEKVLEKKISSFTDDKWPNQVPVASGFYRSQGRKRCIDLVLGVIFLRSFSMS